MNIVHFQTVEEISIAAFFMSCNLIFKVVGRTVAPMESTIHSAVQLPGFLQSFLCPLCDIFVPFFSSVCRVFFFPEMLIGE